ncbi:hypothetical protein ACKAV7_012071 [Fusarium commune]
MSDPNVEARILLALRALQNDPKLSLRRAAGLYQVRYWTLHRRQKGILSTRDSIPKSRKLSDLEEQIIVQFILDLDSRGFPPRLRCVEEMANRLLADREMPPVGKRWASNFVKRHKDLKTHFFRKYDYQRAKCEDPTIIRNWFRLVANIIAKYGIRPDEIYNFDETGFMMGVIASGMVVTGAERRGRPKSVQPGNREWITVIQAINAEGQAIPPFIIGAGQYHLANWYRESDLPGDWAIATSPNGWTDNEIGLEWLKHFGRCTTKQSKNRYRLLILDGHESHHSVDFERYCKANKIITLCIPPHSSHLLQPLDIGCFGLLKKAYGQEIEHLIRCSVTHISKTEFFPAFYTAYQAIMTEKNIKAAFRGAGLAPLDPESVISKLDVQLRTPTPVEEAFAVDDWLAIAAQFMFVIYCSYQLAGVHYGTGRHFKDIPEENLPKAMQMWWTCEPTYVLANMMIKASIGIFLLKICVTRAHKIVIYTITGITEVYCLFFLLLFVLQCRPTSLFWLRHTPNPPEGSCFDGIVIAIAFYGYSAISCLSDWTCSILPIFLVWKLQMSKRTKISVVGILAASAIASSATIVRFPYLYSITDIDDFLYSTSDLAIWSTVETGLAITASAIATLRPLLRNYLDRSSSANPSGRSARAWQLTGRVHPPGGYFRSHGVDGEEAFDLHDNAGNRIDVTSVVHYNKDGNVGARESCEHGSRSDGSDSVAELNARNSSQSGMVDKNGQPKSERRWNVPVKTAVQTRTSDLA